MTNSQGRFEKWVTHRYGADSVQLKNDEDCGDEYENYIVQGEWEAWQAATAGPDAATVALHFGY